MKGFTAIPIAGVCVFWEKKNTRMTKSSIDKRKWRCYDLSNGS